MQWFKKERTVKQVDLSTLKGMKPCSKDAENGGRHDSGSKCIDSHCSYGVYGCFLVICFIL